MNNKTQLSQPEIRKLFEFVQQKNVPYLDVQYEIVDHLASEIEEFQLADRSLSFENALNDIYSQFPITGFAVFQLEKQSSMRQYWKRSFWAYLRRYFRIPRIVFTILLIASFYNIFQYFQSYYLVLGFSTIFFLYVVFYNRYRMKRLEEIQNNYLVIESFMYWMRSFTEFLGWGSYFVYFAYPDLTFSSTSNFLFAVFFGLGLITAYAYVNIFPKMLESDIKQKYHHLGIA